MKKIFYCLIAAIVQIISCSKNETPPAPSIYTLSISAGIGGVVSSQGGSYESGSKVVITATPNAEYVFSGWSNGSTENPLTITLTSNQSIQANFIKRKYALNIIIEGEGTVTEEVISTGKDYDSGTVVKLTAVPDVANDWVFEGWNGVTNSSDTSIQLTVSEAKEVTAKFMRYFDYNKPSIYLRNAPFWIEVDKPAIDNGISTNYFSYTSGYGYADFNGDGYIDYLASKSNNQIERHPLELYINQGDNENFIFENNLISNNVGTEVARKIIVGDYNLDGKPDIFVADHGAEGEEYLFAYPSIMLSIANGYNFEILTNLPKEFHHAATSGDIDNDGDLDIFLSTGYFIINDGRGNFTKDTSKFIYSRQGLYVSELIDLNKDGYLDLVCGGHEMNNNYEMESNTIFWGNGEVYTESNSSLLPKIDEWEVTVDFNFYDIDNDGDLEIFSLKTGGKADENNNIDFDYFYKGWRIMISKLVDNKYVDVTENYIESYYGSERWMVWFRIQDIDNNGKMDLFENDKKRMDSPNPFRWEWNGSIFEKKF